MLLVIEVGNTNTKIGVYDGALLIDVGGSVKRVLAGAVSSGDAVDAPVPGR